MQKMNCDSCGNELRWITPRGIGIKNVTLCIPCAAEVSGLYDWTQDPKIGKPNTFNQAQDLMEDHANKQMIDIAKSAGWISGKIVRFGEIPIKIGDDFKINRLCPCGDPDCSIGLPHDLSKKAEQIIKDLSDSMLGDLRLLKCECGGETAGGSHSAWCPKHSL